MVQTPATIERLLKEAGWIPSSEAADLMGVHWRYIYYLTDQGHLHPQLVGPRHGGIRYYMRSEIEDYMRTHPRVGQVRAKKNAESAA